MTKSELRQIYLKKQRLISDAERDDKSRQIADNFFNNFDVKNIKFLHGFLSIEPNKEINTIIFFERLWKQFPSLITTVPRVDFAAMTLEVRRLTQATKLELNEWKIPEPRTGEIIEIERLDVILVPLLSFDERGFRVGYGKGFYDRFLSECRTNCVKIGLSYFEPVAEISDVRTFDVKLDFCITPLTIWNFEK